MQGREKEVIIFASVRANPRNALGFVADGRRLNVALTRAKRALVIVGNRQTLMHDKLWKLWVQEAHSCSLPGR
jgi:superfamily I DNA and/or RNA helicase